MISLLCPKTDAVSVVMLTLRDVLHQNMLS